MWNNYKNDFIAKVQTFSKTPNNFAIIFSETIIFVRPENWC